MTVAFMPGKAGAAYSPFDCSAGVSCHIVNSATTLSGPEDFMCVDIPGASKVNGIGVQLFNCKETTAQYPQLHQRFTFQKTANITSGPYAGKSAYRIISQNYTDPSKQLCLNVKGGSTAEGAEVIQYTCQFGKYFANEQFILNPSADGLTYQIISRHTSSTISGSKCIRPSSLTSEASIKQFQCSYFSFDYWELMRL